jgi:hypothetical protein
MLEKPPVLGDEEGRLEEFRHRIERQVVVNVPAVLECYGQRAPVAVDDLLRLRVGADGLKGGFDGGDGEKGGEGKAGDTRYPCVNNPRYNTAVI